jgi:hypothetical protein
MYTVISYNNSRNNGTVKFLKVFSSCVKAIRYARKQANSKYGEQNVTARISKQLVNINNIFVQFTLCNGIEMDVFAVVTLPEEKDDEEIIESEKNDDIEEIIESEKETKIMSVDFDDILLYDEYEKYGEIYDDRYDEREDDDSGYGYEDECFECLDF